MNTTEFVADPIKQSLHLLDMGNQMYGDCLLCRFGGKNILIDGGHSSDFDGQEGFVSIPDQLETLLGHPPPFDVDLLVVTHCHSDHIGCLPKMVDSGVLIAKWALVADEKLGFGRSADDAVDIPPQFAGMIAALREEDRSAMKSDADLLEFLTDAATLETRYKAMLRTLEQAGTKLRRYGRDSIDDLVNEFKATGMQILGPERDHLIICAEAIARFTKDAIDSMAELGPDWVAGNEVALYRYLMRRQISDAVDRPGKGAALNDQSIVLYFEVAGKKLLLTGDMQFAVPEVAGLGPYMTEIRKKIGNLAPFDFVKLAHHASYNGFDTSVLDEMGDDTRNFAMSGGIDAGHPDPGVLSLLKANRRRLTLARTDRNGLISMPLASTRNVEMQIDRGRLNDFSPNTDTSTTPPLASQAASPVQVAPSPVVSVRPVAAEASNIEIVEVLSRVPHKKTRVVVTIDVTPGGEPTTVSVPTIPASTSSRIQSDPGVVEKLSTLKIGGGRSLSKLLFVTNRDALCSNIGRAEADQILKALTAQGHQVIEQLPTTSASDAVTSLRPQLPADVAGIVLLGGYDVVPPNMLDVLDAKLRRQVGSPTGDADNFVVWNDEIYGDKDGDGLPELPVSRIPDAKSAELIATALQAQVPSKFVTRFGVRNRERPFAEDIFLSLPGSAQLLQSEPTMTSGITESAVSANNVYLMLHGADYDGTRFWGEDDDGTVEAFSIQNVPSLYSGVIFTGCCWGALIADVPACKVRRGQPIAVRTAEASVALAFLKAGGVAFIGCTGTHYSPTVRPYAYFGGPMHTAFWTRYLTGTSPAQALFDAKVDFIRGMPHGRNSPSERAIEMKILRQFTCLGLGW